MRHQRGADRRQRVAEPPTIYYEDLAQAGRIHIPGSYEFTRERIFAFASEFDPQPFHLDDEAAVAGPFGGLVASGWHSAAVCIRLLVDGLYLASANLGSPGVDELKWPRPVRVGDRVQAVFNVLESRESSSKPDRGIVRSRVELVNQDGDVVLELTAATFFAKRAAAVE